MKPPTINEQLQANGYVWDPQARKWFPPGRVRAQRDRHNPQLQKQQDDHSTVQQTDSDGPGHGGSEGSQSGPESVPGQAAVNDNQAGISGGDESNDFQYRVTITIRFSNRRRTDLPGKLDTILDCIVRATRRLLDQDTGYRNQGGAVRSGGRGSNDNDPKTVKGWVPF